MDDERRDRTDAGISMLLTVISLLITALLILFALTTMFDSSGNGSVKLSDNPGVGMADDLTAQQTLQTSMTTADAQAAESGGYGTVTADGLTAANPSITYVNGPSSSSTTVSVATTSTGTPGAGAGAGAAGGGGAGASAIAGARAAAGAAGSDGSDGSGLGDGSGSGGGSGGSGSITLAIHSSSGICWLIWKGAGGGTWFGEQTGLSSCTAPPLSAAPVASAVSSTAIGWRYGAFPGI